MTGQSGNPQTTLSAKNAQSNKSAKIVFVNQRSSSANALMFAQKREVEKVSMLKSSYDAGNLALVGSWKR